VILVVLAVIIGILGLFPYCVYTLGIMFGKKQDKLRLREDYPPISVVLSAYNESPNVEKRIQNLAECRYPDMEVIFVDDRSSDNTADRARYYLDTYNLNYRLILNPERMGVSQSYNNAIRQATRDIIVVTDADVSFKSDALHRLITRLLSYDSIGAVTGDLQPRPSTGTTTGLESQYRSVYGKMCSWESAHDSTFNFNGAIVAFRRGAVRWINQKVGADDANIAFEVIRNGYRAVYELDAVVYESIPASFKVQYKQKIRRATGLIESVLANKDTGRVKPFATFYVLRAYMLMVSPTLVFLSSGLGLASVALAVDPLMMLIVAVVCWSIVMSSWFIKSFFLNQIYLVMGLLNVGNNVQTWESTTSLNKKE
jgi:cellulose synthase/poly-beta-1,6-N-acetylglucosamine synthase-like glycosyltransferase